VVLFLLNATRGALCLAAFSLPLSIAISQIALGGAALFWIIRMTMTGTQSIPRLGVGLFVWWFVAAEVVSTILAVDPLGSFLHLKRLLLIPVVYLLAAHATDSSIRRQLAWAFFAGMVIYAGSGIIWYVMHPGQRIRHLHHFMTAGGIAMLGAAATLAWTFCAPEGRRRWILGLGSLAVVGCLILTNTRGSWLGFFLASSFVLYVARPKWLWLIPLAITLFLLLTPPAFQPRLQHFFDPTWRTNANRIHWWRVGREIFKDYPVFGIGDVNPTPIYRQYAVDRQTRLKHFHSNYVHTAVTLGLFGLAAFLAMMTAVLVRLVQAFRRNREAADWQAAWTLAALAALLAFSLNGFFEYNFGDSEVVTILWFLVGSGLAGTLRT